MIVSGFTAALDLDTYPLRNRNLIRPRCEERAKPGRGKPVLIMHIGFFSLFSRHISRTQSFQQNRHITFLALVALKLLVSLISRLVACSPRIVVDTQIHTQTHTQTHRTTTVTLAAHALRACAPRVNNADIVITILNSVYNYYGSTVLYSILRGTTTIIIFFSSF